MAAKTGTVSGIKIYVHATFLVLIGWIALVYWSRYRDLVLMRCGIGLIVLRFICIVRYELGHAPAEGGRELPVHQVMQRHCVTVDVSETLEAVLPRLQEAKVRVWPLRATGNWPAC